MFRVLMPVDADVDRALRQARFCASLPDAPNSVEVTIQFVFQGDEGEDMPEELRRFKSATRVESVREAEEFLESEGVAVSIVDTGGDAAEDILREAADLEPDLIVLGGRKRSPVGKALFGSVTQSVILETDYPVAVTGKASGD